MNKRIYLSPPHMGEHELKFIHEAFDSNWVSPAGPHLEAFEKELTEYNAIPYCAALSSGTAAIHLALIIMDIHDGDEVLCSSFTFSGSSNPIIYQRATPVFVDSEHHTWNMDPDLLEEAINDRIRRGKKPKAVVIVHLYGMPAKIARLISIAQKYEIPVIEDAAEAIGSTYNGQKLGTFGDIGIYSFNGNKIITTSGGGAFVSRNEKWVQKAKFLATQARDSAPYYLHSEIGYNYRLSNICAGIGRGQLMVLDKRVEQRRSVFNYYKKAFEGTRGILFQDEAEGSYSNRWLTTILIDPSIIRVTYEEIRIALERNNIESRPLWKPMHQQPVFKHSPYYGNGVSDKLFESGLCLPSGSSLTTKELSSICSIIKETLNQS